MSSMPIYVSRVTGQKVKIEIDSSDTIATLRKLSGATMKLIFAGMNLIDCKTLADYNIWRDSTIHEVFGLRGCSAEEYKKMEAKADDCPICLEKIIFDDVILPCSGIFGAGKLNKHKFHRHCIDKYIKEKMDTSLPVECPLCRAKISS